MNSLTDPHDEDLRTATPDREITLGTTLLLGIFFALAALCAAFFGFGYSLGAKHTSAVTVTSETQPSLKLNGAKPAAGSAAPVAKASADSTDTPAPKPAQPAGQTATQTATVDPTPAEAPPARAHAPADTTPVAASAPPPPPAPGATQFLVQIAAVTHQEDADLIASTLTRRGYAVNIRPEPQDKLLHVQVGPFPTKKDAEAMRQRLMADGFNAYIK